MIKFRYIRDKNFDNASNIEIKYLIFFLFLSIIYLFCKDFAKSIN